MPVGDIVSRLLQRLLAASRLSTRGGTEAAGTCRSQSPLLAARLHMRRHGEWNHERCTLEGAAPANLKVPGNASLLDIALLMALCPALYWWPPACTSGRATAWVDCPEAQLHGRVLGGVVRIAILTWAPSGMPRVMPCTAA